MDLSNLIKTNQTIQELEEKINQNGEEFISLLNSVAKELQLESENLISIKKSSGVQFSLEFGKYEVSVFLMDFYGVPSTDMQEFEGKNITMYTIASNQSNQKYYCGCISFYYIEKGFNDDSPVFLKRAFINKDFDIAFQSVDKYIVFMPKEIAIKDLKKTLIGIIANLFIGIPHYKKIDDIFQIDKSSLIDRRYKSIGFK